MNTPEEINKNSQQEKPNFSQEEIANIRELGVDIINGKNYLVLNPGHLKKLKEIINIDYPVIEIKNKENADIALIDLDHLTNFLNGLIRKNENGVIDFSTYDLVISEVLIPEFNQDGIEVIKNNLEFFKKRDPSMSSNAVKTLKQKLQSINELRAVYHKLIIILQSNKLRKAPSLLIDTIRKNYIE